MKSNCILIFKGVKRDIANCIGFSLFELLVVLVIIGIAASMVVPRLGGSVDKLQLRTAVNDLAAVLRFARSQAVTRGQDQIVFVDPTTRIVVVLPTVPDRDDSFVADISAAGAVKHQYQLPDGVMVKIDDSVAATTASRSEIASFFSMGNSTGGSIVLIDKAERSRQIDIDVITGTVTVVK